MNNIVSNLKYIVANDWMTESNEAEGM